MRVWKGTGGRVVKDRVAEGVDVGWGSLSSPGNLGDNEPGSAKQYEVVDCLFACLLLFYVLATSKARSEWEPTCDCDFLANLQCCLPVGSGSIP